MRQRRCVYVLVWILCALVGLPASSAPKKKTSNYYKVPLQFHFNPDPTAVRTKIGRFGATGISIELQQPAFTMVIYKLDAGSPSAATGKLKPGQIIVSINGESLKDIDPRVQLGDLITKIEATDGVVKLMVKDNPKATAVPVEFKIPLLGAYSETWPVDCKKSDAIVRNFADFLAKEKNLGWGAAQFLLSTGEEKDLDVVRRHYSGKLDTKNAGNPWSIGYASPGICEYYLRTGDKSVLPALQAKCDYLKRTIYNGSWMGRGGASFGYMAGGHMNAAGVHSLKFLLMAKECGVDVDEHTLQTCLVQFFRYAGHGNVPYGDGVPEGGFTDNGRVGGLAFAMQTAANLVPDGENSVYAKARDISATKSFYSTSWLFHGHTGGGIGELWRGSAMALVREKRPKQYRTFMDERRWLYDLARTHEGSFAWPEGINVSYTGANISKPGGNFIPWVYTMPRKKLRLFGAPPTQFSKTYQLPSRPWGTEADDAFLSIEAGEYAPGKKLDLSKEVLLTDASMPIMKRLGDPKVSDETLLAYALHIDQGIRSNACGNIVKHGRTHLILPLLKSKDPRGRLSGLNILIGGGGKNKGISDDVITDEMINLAAAMVEDPKESWWVVDWALRLLGKAKPELVGPHVERIAYWLKHDEWWLRRAALIAATPIVADKKYYKTILPIVSEMIAKNERAVALSPVPGIVEQLQDADPEVQQFGTQVLAQAYSKFPKLLSAPGGQDMSNGTDYLLKHIAGFLSKAPGGFDELYRVSKERNPNAVLPHKSIYLSADSSKFGPNVKKAFEPLVMEYLIPQYMAEGNHIASNRELLLNEGNSIAVKGNFYYREPRMDKLVSLYQRVGINDYNWHDFGPALTEINWDYHTFDPPEKKLWSPGTRYRKVTFPKGMENWFSPDFDAKSAGWKAGNAPFGQLGGKLVTEPGGCKDIWCRCSEPMKTFWENEVLLIRAKVKFPAFKEGHRYRLCIGGMSHVNHGDGYRLYINGKLVKERTRGVGKREGGRPECYYIEKKFWPDFDKEVTIAATSFLPIPGGKRSPGVKKNHFSVFIQEMNVPPLTDDQFKRGKLLKPMRCTAWQATKEDDDLYRYDGEFVKNPAVLGQWTLAGRIAGNEMLEAGTQINPDPKAPLQGVTFKVNGETDNDRYAWSGTTLMDLAEVQALEITPKTIDGVDYLLIEAGNFSKKVKKDWKPDHPAGWVPDTYVMKRAK